MKNEVEAELNTSFVWQKIKLLACCVGGVALVICLVKFGFVEQVLGAEFSSDQEIRSKLEDSLYSDEIVLREDIDGSSNILCIKGPNDGEKVMDLNGHTLVCKGMYNYTTFRLTDSVGGGKVVLTDGTIGNSGTLLIDGATVVSEKDTAIKNWWNGVFRITTGNVSTSSPRSALNNDGGICIIDGGRISGGEVAIWSAPGGGLYGATSANGTGGATCTYWQSGTLVISGGLIEGGLELHDTDVTITGGVVRGRIEMVRRNEYKDGHPIKLETPQEMQYRNDAGDTITLPKPTYELHEENGEMKRGYWDVPTDAWFYAPVQTLMDDRVLDYGGYDDKGNFGPTEPLTRGQAAALLARACGAEAVEEATESPFLDVTDATPYAKYINAGKKLSLLSGNGQGRFYPESTVTRQEFAVLVMNVVHKYGWELLPEAPSVVFQDEDAIAPWARDAVAEGACYGLWNGTDSGEFLPLNPITRAEGATILARLMKVMDINPNEI